MDVALPLVVLVAQLVAAPLTAGLAVLHPVHLGALDWILLLAGPAALLQRRRHPVAVLCVCLAATLAPAGSSAAYLSAIVAFFGAATAGHRYAAWAAIAVRLIWGITAAPTIYGAPALSLTDALLLAGWVLVLIIAAEATRIQTERAEAARAAEDLERRRRASEQRLRIARDLHDVIGHNISLIIVQASMGLDLMDSQPDQVRAALGAIKTASKEALQELRTMLTTLRTSGDIAPRSPAPGIDRLPELVELTCAAGLQVDLEITGMARPLPTAVQLATYRIIQESLTNVARHAGAAPVTVRLTYSDTHLRIEVIDTGKPHAARTSAMGTGSGIAGMRERAAALGGDLDAGFCPDGGFRVVARLPIQATR